MARNDASQVLLRQWEMLKMLPHAGGMTSGHIHRALNDLGFAVSKRSVERDLHSLQQVFEIECLDEAKPFGWRWAESAVNQRPAVDKLPSVSLTDAVSLHMIGHSLKPLLPASMLGILNNRLRAANRKLDTAAAGGLHDWLNKIAHVPAQMNYLPPDVDNSILHQLQLAVIQEQQIQAQYQSLKDPAPRHLRLHPLAFVLRGSVTYLVARNQDTSEIHRHASHRFKDVKLLDKKAVRVGFDLQDYLATGAMQFGDPRPMVLEAKIDDVLYRLLTETPIAEQQTISELEDHHYLLRVKVIKSWQLNWWLLSKSQHIEVLKPVAYREEIKTALQKSLSKYQ